MPRGLRTLALAALLTALAGCRSIPVYRAPIETASVLVLPVRDGLRAGRPYRDGDGTGERFERSLSLELGGRGWEVLGTESRGFNRHFVSDARTARLEGLRVGTRYVLQLALGEMNEGLPLVGYEDFVTLELARMIEVSSGEIVWCLQSPIRHGSRTNLGTVGGLVDDLARWVRISITGERGN